MLTLCNDIVILYEKHTKLDNYASSGHAIIKAPCFAPSGRQHSAS